MSKNVKLIYTICALKLNHIIELSVFIYMAGGEENNATNIHRDEKC